MNIVLSDQTTGAIALQGIVLLDGVQWVINMNPAHIDYTNLCLQEVDKQMRPNII